MRIDELVTFAADAALEKAEVSARADAWKARATGEAERIRMQTPGCREFMSGEARLGTLRLDGADLPATASVSDSAALGAYLAEHHPDQAAATITVPASMVDLLIGAMESLGVTATVKVAPVDAAGFLKDSCKVIAGETAGTWTVRDVTGETARDVPGVTATRPQPTWKLIPNSEMRRERIAAAIDMVDGQVEAMREPVAPLAVVPDPAPEPEPSAPTTALGRYKGALTVRELKAACKDAGLPTSGTGAELLDETAAYQASVRAAREELKELRAGGSK